MICAACNKESNNRRVCPFCFTPYPADGSQGRASTSMGRMTGSQSRAGAGESWSLGPLEPLRTWFVRQTPVVKWSTVGIVVVGALWMFSGGEKVAPTNGPTVTPVSANAPPMTREEAVALIKHTRENALVDEQSDEVAVSYPAASFPVQSEGQVMLAMRFARADEVVMGRKRRIFFHSPNGKMFAQSDAVTGLTVVK